MKNITIYLPDLYVKFLDELGQQKNVSRSELLRIAINDYLKKDLNLYCTCYKLYEDKSLNESPELVIKKIQEILKNFKKFNEHG